MKKIVSLLLTALLVLMLFAGCGGSAKSGAAYDMAAEAPQAAPVEMMKTEAAGGAVLEEMETGNTGANVPQDRKWIVTVDMSVETEDLDSLMEALNGHISEMQGYVEDQNIRNGSAYVARRYRSASLTVRVPADQVDAFTQAVGGIANVVRSSKSMEDITLTYVSTESRMKALQTEEARLLELMEQAETMSDLLEIEARLTDVRYELESVTSRLRTYDNQVDYATIYVNIEEVQEYTPVKERTVWERISEGFVSSVKGLWKSLVDVFVWILVNSPYLLVWGIVLTGGVWLLRRLRKWKPRKKNKKAPKPEAPEQAE